MTSFSIGDRVEYIGYNEVSRRNYMPSEGVVVQGEVGHYGTVVQWETGALVTHYPRPTEMTTSILSLVDNLANIIEPPEDIYKDLI